MACLLDVWWLLFHTSVEFDHSSFQNIEGNFEILHFLILWDFVQEYPCRNNAALILFTSSPVLRRAILKVGQLS